MYCLFWICSGNYSSTVGFINNTIKREFHGGKEMKVKDLVALYNKSFFYDVTIQIDYSGYSDVYKLLEIPENILESIIGNIVVWDNGVICIELEGEEIGLDSRCIGKNTRKKLLENVKDMKPKEIIKYMKTFLGKDKIRDEYDINAYASYIYCKNNKLI